MNREELVKVFKDAVEKKFPGCPEEIFNPETIEQMLKDEAEDGIDDFYYYVCQVAEEKKYRHLWYAVVENPDDDWDWGSRDRDEALEMARQLSDTAYVAIIDDSDSSPLCVGEISREDF